MGRIFLIFLLALFVFKSNISFGQETSPKDKNSGILYTKERSFGIIAHSAGWGFNYRRIKNNTAFAKKILALEVVSMRHPKEQKVKNAAYNNSKGFVYGKLNSLWFVRPEIALQKIIYGKEISSAVQISMITGLGASLCFAKPLYLEIINKTSDPNIDRVSVEAYDPEKHSIYDIYGKAPFAIGIEQTKIYPGGFGRIAFNFDYSQIENAIKSIETGIVADFMPVPVPFMAFQPKQSIFFNLYLSLTMGKKWF